MADRSSADRPAADRSRQSEHHPRRKRMVLIIAATIVVLLAGAVGLAAYKGRPVTIPRDIELPFALDESLREALYYASLAPSSHNAQMWQITALPIERQFVLKFDSNRNLDVVDPAGRESLISLGAFSENLLRALDAYGYQAELEITTEQYDSTATDAGPTREVARISYGERQTTSVDNNALHTMTLRHSDKRPFTNEVLPEAAVAKMFSASTSVYFPAGTEDFDYLSAGTIDAFTQQSNNLEARGELASWIRLSDGDTLIRRDGLPAEQLGITGLTKTLYYLITSPDSLTSNKFADQGISQASTQASNCAGFGIISGPNTPSGLITVGRDLQSLWLAATEAGISMQLMSQLLEEEPFASDIDNKLGMSKPVQVVLRLGIAGGDYGANALIRRPLSDFVNEG